MCYKVSLQLPHRYTPSCIIINLTKLFQYSTDAVMTESLAEQDQLVDHPYCQIKGHHRQTLDFVEGHQFSLIDSFRKEFLVLT